MPVILDLGAADARFTKLDSPKTFSKRGCEIVKELIFRIVFRKSSSISLACARTRIVSLTSVWAFCVACRKIADHSPPMLPPVLLAVVAGLREALRFRRADLTTHQRPLASAIGVHGHPHLRLVDGR